MIHNIHLAAEEVPDGTDTRAVCEECGALATVVREITGWRVTVRHRETCTSEAPMIEMSPDDQSR